MSGDEYQVLELHLLDEETGRCTYCYDEHGIWTPHPCTAYQWAERARAATEENA